MLIKKKIKHLVMGNVRQGKDVGAHLITPMEIMSIFNIIALMCLEDLFIYLGFMKDST